MCVCVCHASSMHFPHTSKCFVCIKTTYPSPGPCEVRPRCASKHGAKKQKRRTRCHKIPWLPKKKKRKSDSSRGSLSPPPSPLPQVASTGGSFRTQLLGLALVACFCLETSVAWKGLGGGGECAADMHHTRNHAARQHLRVTTNNSNSCLFSQYRAMQEKQQEKKKKAIIADERKTYCFTT